MDTSAARGQANPVLKKGFSLSEVGQASSGGADARPPRPLTAFLQATISQSMAALPTASRSDAASDSQSQFGLQRASSSSLLHGLRSPSADRAPLLLPVTAHVKSAKGNNSLFSPSSEDGPAPGTLPSPASSFVANGSKRVTDTRQFSSALSATSPAHSPVKSPSGIFIRTGSHVGTVQRLREGSSGASTTSAPTMSRFLNGDELRSADLDKRQLVQEWLAVVAREDEHFTSAMISAELKLRCVHGVCGPSTMLGATVG